MDERPAWDVKPEEYLLINNLPTHAKCVVSVHSMSFLDSGLGVEIDEPQQYNWHMYLYAYYTYHLGGSFLRDSERRVCVCVFPFFDWFTKATNRNAEIHVAGPTPYTDTHLHKFVCRIFPETGHIICVFSCSKNSAASGYGVVLRGNVSGYS